MFDSHALLETFRQLAAEEKNGRKYQFVSDNDEPRPAVESQFRAPGQDQFASKSVLTEARLNNFEQGFASRGANLGSLDDGWKAVAPWYSDQVPPFNITLTGVNEQGYASTMSVLGVEILNEGYGISIDDIVSEQQMTYVARGISPWTRITGAAFQRGTKSNPAVGTRKSG